MKILTEEQLLEQTLNTRGTRELIYNVDGFDRIENLQHSSYQSSIKIDSMPYIATVMISKMSIKILSGFIFPLW
jgi:hypothetical protein